MTAATTLANPLPAWKAVLHLVRAIVRLERRQFARPRLTEPGFQTWRVFARRLTMIDFIRLVLEDAAEAYPLPFDLERLDTPDLLSQLAEDEGQKLIEAAVEAERPEPDALAVLNAAAQDLGLPRLARAIPRKLAQHQKALELPGLGGRIAFLAVQADTGLSFDRQFTFVADSAAERLLVGLAAIEAKAAAPTVWTSQELEAKLGKGPMFDRIFGFDDHVASNAARASLERGHPADAFQLLRSA